MFVPGISAFGFLIWSRNVASSQTMPEFVGFRVVVTGDRGSLTTFEPIRFRADLGFRRHGTARTL
jgi:hypothetical protein